MFTRLKDNSINFLKAHPKAASAVCKVGDFATKGAFAGGVGFMAATAAGAEGETTTTTVIDSLVSTAQSTVNETYLKILPVLALIMGLNFGIRKIRGVVGG